MKKLFLALSLVAASVSAFAEMPIVSGMAGNKQVFAEPLHVVMADGKFEAYDLNLHIRDAEPGQRYLVCPVFSSGVMIDANAVEVTPNKTGSVLAKFYREDGKTPVTPLNCLESDKPLNVKVEISSSKGFHGEFDLGVGFEAHPITSR